MGRKGRFSSRRAGISLWAQLMPGEWSLEYTCQVWFGSVNEQPINNNFKKIGQKGRFSAQRAGITLWAQLMPGEWSLEYICRVWFGSVYE